MASWSTAAPVDPLDEETTTLLKELDLAKEAELKRENLMRELQAKLAAKLETVKTPLDEETTRLLKDLDLAKEAEKVAKEGELKRENLVLRHVHEKLAAKLETVKKQRDDLRAQNEEMGKTLSARARAREAILQKLKDLGAILDLGPTRKHNAPGENAKRDDAKRVDGRTRTT